MVSSIQRQGNPSLRDTLELDATTTKSDNTLVADAVVVERNATELVSPVWINQTGIGRTIPLEVCASLRISNTNVILTIRHRELT